jgi:hypothetical protein
MAAITRRATIVMAQAPSRDFYTYDAQLGRECTNCIAA